MFLAAGGPVISDLGAVRVGFGVVRAVGVAGLCGALAACSGGAGLLAKLDQGVTQTLAPQSDQALQNIRSEDVAAVPPEEESGEARPYRVAGRWFVPQADPSYDKTGTASWYGAAFQGRLTANGETFDRMALTAAHPTMPLPSYVRVTNLDNDSSVIVRVNDRGPYSGGRLIDVSERAAELLAFHRDGTTNVRVEYLSPAPMDRNDQGMLVASYRTPGETPASVPGVMLAAVQGRESAPPISAGERGPTIVAFTARDASVSGGAAEAMESVTGDFSAGDRIFMAFQAASEAEQ